MANTNISTDLNVPPYWDDFDPKKNFYRILFRPSFAVQARELTQMQSMLQNQIDSFAEHIFVEGSLVTGGSINYDRYVEYVKIHDNDFLNVPVNVDNLKGLTFRGISSNVSAVVVDVSDGNEIEANTKTLHVKYISSGGANNDQKTFTMGERLETVGSNTVYSVNVISSNSLGRSSLFTIDEGIVFGKDHFVYFEKQQVILDRYSPNPSVKVGFLLNESIITPEEDISLNDPAQGSFNYAAPGAHRLKITANLTAFELSANTGNNFVSIYEIKDGEIQQKADKPQYSEIRDEWARRTFDESGHYIVRGLGVRLREHLDDGQNQGWKPLADGGDANKLAVGVEPGKAYVLGYDYENLVTRYVEVDKGIDYENVEQLSVGANYGSYVEVDDVCGAWNVNEGAIISLRDAFQNKVTSGQFSTTSVAGNQIGTARFKAIEYVSGVQGSATAKYRIYLYDIKMNTEEFTKVKSLHIVGVSPEADAFADIVTINDEAIIRDTNFNRSIFTIPASNIRSIRDESNNVDTTLQFLRTFDVTISTAGTFSVSTGLSDERFPFSSGLLNNTQKNTNFVITLNGSVSTGNLSGTISVTSGSPNVTGAGTLFNTQLKVGEKIIVSATGEVYTIQTINSDTSLVLSTNVSSDASGSNFAKRYIAGEIIDMTINGASGNAREINITSTTTAAFDMQESLATTVSATVSCRLNKVDAREIKKSLNTNRFVKINCATSGITGPFNLGMADVFRIVSVRRKTGSDFANENEGVDVTSQFRLDNGQRDNMYDHAKLLKIGGSLGPTDYLLVKLDVFAHDFSQGVGYFSVDSYPIDDTGATPSTIQTKQIPIYSSPITGVSYNLRDCIDTRPVKASTANHSTTVAGASISPGDTTTLKGIASGLHTLVPNSQILADLSYYLSRKDVVTVNSKGNISVVRGVPAILPITPTPQEDAMAIATITIAPYPSLPPQIAKQADRPYYGCSITATAPQRFTMRDIGVLKNRIQNLEYYTTLTLLEKSALDMKIIDANGLDRFKNGIFVDAFKSHAVADVSNVDYSCAVDPQANELRPKFKLGHNRLQLDSFSGMVQNGNVLTRPFTHVPFISQQYATNTRNAAGVFYKFKGLMSLSPDGDTWTDTQTLPDLQITDDSDYQAWLTVADAWGIHWNDWQTVWSGTTTTTNTSQTRNVLSTGTTTTTTTTQTRTGTQLNVNPVTTTQNYGERVVDTALVPYIRSQPVALSIAGLKANTKHYVFFDGEAVSSYVTPYDSNGEPTGVEGDPTVSDANGNLYCVLRIPNDDSKKFRVGTRAVVVTDSLLNSDDATSSAQGQFTAFGLTQTKQNTIVSTTTASVTTSTTQQTQTITNSTFSRTDVPLTFDLGVNGGVNNSNGSGADPIAQTFFIDLVDQVSGCFLTKIDLYFAEKSETYGVIVEIREVDQVTGMITSKVIPGSRVIKNVDDINVSDDGSVATTFEFGFPIFLYNRFEYAFVVIPVANNPDTRVWTARLGETDIASGIRINEQPYTGNMALSSNQRQWNILQEEDIKFSLYRANFETGSGTVTFTNDDVDFLKVNTITSAFNVMGEKVHSETRFTLADVGGTIDPDMILEGNTSGATGVVSFVSGSNYRMKDVSITPKFTTSETLIVRYANGLNTGYTAVLDSQQTFEATVINYNTLDSNNIIVELDDSTGNFVVGEQIKGQTSNATAIIEEIVDNPYSTIDFEPCEINFVETSTVWDAQLTSNTAVVDTGWTRLNPNDNNSFKVEKVVYSKTNEVASISGAKSMKFRGTAITNSPFVTPIIDTTKTYNIWVYNIINNDATGEDASNGGNAKTRYISQKVTLEDGQDAEDLNVFLTCYKPPGTSVRVYYKILNGEDSDTFDSASWVEMSLASKDVFSDAENSQDFREFKWVIPEEELTGPNGEVQYVNSQGVTFTGYKYFSVKVVLLSDSSAIVPRCKELRCIALQI